MTAITMQVTLLLVTALSTLISTARAANLGYAHQAAKSEQTLTSLPVVYFLLGLLSGAVTIALVLHYCVWKPREARRRNEWSLPGVSQDDKTVVGDDEEMDAEQGSNRQMELVPATRSPPVQSLVLPLPTRNDSLPRLSDTNSLNGVTPSHDGREDARDNTKSTLNTIDDVERTVPAPQVVASNEQQLSPSIQSQPLNDHAGTNQALEELSKAWLVPAWSFNG